MSLILFDFAIALAGLAVTAILFYRIPKLPCVNKKISNFPTVSIIIPARNEERNLPLLLLDISAQSLPAFEIICVDDESEDSTAQIALAYGAKLISLKAKPEGWTGKSWACQNGADAATGELLLFLDADVRLGPDGLHTLVSAYVEQGCTVSVQPYHKTEKKFEQFSLLFNLVQIAANGTALPTSGSVGLYGPVILMSRPVYKKIGGHESVKTSIVDDIALGLRLKKTGLPFCLYVGNHEISFRMYESGLHSLLQGWVKNIATGAAKTPIIVFMMVFLWISSLTLVPLQLVQFTVLKKWTWLILYFILYLVWVFLLHLLARSIGRFQIWSLLFYPLLLLVFMGVIVVSACKKLFGQPVTWKGRMIRTEESTYE